MGRVRKSKKLPFDMRRDCRNADSHMGPRIKVIISGAAS